MVGWKLKCTSPYKQHFTWEQVLGQSRKACFTFPEPRSCYPLLTSLPNNVFLGNRGRPGYMWLSVSTTSVICPVGDGVPLNFKLPMEFAFGQGISRWQGEKGWVSRFCEKCMVRGYGSWELLRHKSLEIILTSEPGPSHCCLLALCHQPQTHLLFFHQP